MALDSAILIYAAVGVFSTALGYGGFRFIFSFIQKRLGTDVSEQRLEIIEDAKKQSVAIRAEYEDIESEKLQLFQEELETELKTTREIQTVSEEEINSGEQFFQGEESRVNRYLKEVETTQNKVKTLEKDLHERQTQLVDATNKLRKRLEEASRVNMQKLLTTLTDEIIEARRLECQKLLRFTQDDLQTSSLRHAKRVLSDVLSRYDPKFSWPKAVNHIEVEDPKMTALIGHSEETLATEIIDIKTRTGIEVEVFPDTVGGSEKLVVKFSGGSGLEREAFRLALNEVAAIKHSSLGTLNSIFQRYCRELDEQAVNYGKQAIKELKLDNIHPELQKMIGQLYWRTSYRQNQYYHSLEVAKLAGILAYEFKLDVELAKRAALLHDIGKSIDYRIDQNHALISADYADRYGEPLGVCNAILTHHNDIVSDAPIANILKTADTLSGARPGTRVNLEEGYQIRLSAIEDVIRSFQGIQKSAIMNGGREVHVEVNPKKVKEEDLKTLSDSIAKKIESDVAFPGQIKVLVSRRFEAVVVA